MKVYAGVDAGQSSTTALIADERGTILGTGHAGAADDVGRSLADSAAAIDSAVALALRAAGAQGDTRIERLVAGLSGLDASRDERPVLATRAGEIVWLHDTDIAHAGALGGRHGIVVIAGTGSAALGIDASGTRVFAGGWGYLFGDAGSAFWLGRRALSAAMAAEDRGRDDGLKASALAHFTVDSLRAIQHGFGAGTIDRARVAAFAQRVAALAAEDVAAAALLIDEAADALCSLVVAVDRRLAPAAERLVSYHGGLWRDEPLLARWESALATRLPVARIVPPLAGAAEGALRIARDERAGADAQRAPAAPVRDVLPELRGGLIVSVQADEDSPLNVPGAIALLARAAALSGAAGVRIEGVERIAAVHEAVAVPIIGIIKRKHAGFAPYITSTVSEIDEVAAAGADVVAFDATDRPRAGGASVSMLIDAIHARGLVAMADCSTAGECRAAAAAGADIVATTLAGYTDASRGRTLPAIDVVAAVRDAGAFVVCEGGIAQPEQVRAAFAAGAAAVVVGTALTNLDVNVRRFVAEAPR